MTESYSNFPDCSLLFCHPKDELHRLAEEMKGLCAKGQFEKVLDVVNGCLPKDDACEFDAEGERSDVVHDLLAHLAEEMIRMNKEKQEEIRGFLAWLEEFGGARVDDPSNKTKVMAYYEIDFGELLSVLKKNKRKLGVDPSRRAFSEDLRREFSASMEKLAPLLLRIGETDRLIDLVVYKLYGLTGPRRSPSSKRAFRDPRLGRWWWRAWGGVFLWPLRGQRRPAQSRRAVEGRDRSRKEKGAGAVVRSAPPKCDMLTASGSINIIRYIGSRR